MKSHMFMIKPWVLISQAAKPKPGPLSWNAVANRPEQSWRQPSRVAVNVVPGLQMPGVFPQAGLLQVCSTRGSCMPPRGSFLGKGRMVPWQMPKA